MPAPDPLTRRKRKGKELDEGTIKRLREEELNKTPEERSHWHYNIICICVCVCVCVSMTSERGGRRGRGGEKREREGYSSISSRLNEAVTPLLSTPYSEQLTMKEKAMSEFLKKMAKRISSKDSYPVKLACVHLCLTFVMTELFSGKMVF